MNKERKITRGGLSGKMSGYTPEPPESVWEGVSAEIRGGKPRRRFFILLAAAAGLALALSVGLRLVLHEGIPDQELATGDAGETLGQPGEKNMPADPIIAESVPEQKQQEETSDPESMKTSTEEVSRLEKMVKQTVEEILQEEPEQERVRVAALEEEQGSGVENRDDATLEPEFSIDEDKETVASIEIENTFQEVGPDEDSLLRIIQNTPDKPLEVADKKGPGKWQIGAALSPLVSYRDAASPDMAQNTIVNNSESPRLTYAGGLQVSYLQSSRLTIESGVYYNKMGVNIGDYSSFKGGWFSGNISYSERVSKVVSISNSMGTVVSNNDEAFLNNYQADGTVADYHLLEPEVLAVGDAAVDGFSQSFDYLEIPLNVKYKIIDRSVDLQLIGGISTNLLVNNSISAITPDGAVKIGEVKDVRTMNYSGNLGVGMIYDLFERISLTVEPRFRYYLNSINAQYLPPTRPYSFGVYTGIQYLF